MTHFVANELETATLTNCVCRPLLAVEEENNFMATTA